MEWTLFAVIGAAFLGVIGVPACLWAWASLSDRVSEMQESIEALRSEVQRLSGQAGGLPPAPEQAPGPPPLPARAPAPPSEPGPEPSAVDGVDGVRDPFAHAWGSQAHGSAAGRTESH